MFVDILLYVIYIQEELELGKPKKLIIVNLAKYNRKCAVSHHFSDLFTVPTPLSNPLPPTVS